MLLNHRFLGNSFVLLFVQNWKWLNNVVNHVATLKANFPEQVKKVSPKFGWELVSLLKGSAIFIERKTKTYAKYELKLHYLSKRNFLLSLCLNWWALHLLDTCYYFGFYFTIIILKLVNKAICLKIWPYNFKMQNLKRILSWF